MLRSKTRYVAAKVSLGQFNSKCFGLLWQYHSTEAPYLFFNLSPTINNLSNRQRRRITHLQRRGELSYLVPLGSANISAPHFKQCFFRGGGGITPPPDWVKHHAPQSQDRNKKYFISYIEFCINNKI
jgi:hypothetical protein